MVTVWALTLQGEQKGSRRRHGHRPEGAQQCCETPRLTGLAGKGHIIGGYIGVGVYSLGFEV